MPSILEELLIEFPKKEWLWCELSKNPNISVEFIDNHPELPWEWGPMAANPNITLEFMKKTRINHFGCLYYR